jgi:hypothetical protein
MIVLDNGDKLRGDAAVASVIDYTIYGLDNNALKQLADGQLANSTGDLFTADSTDVVTTMILVNADSSERAINLFLLPSGGTARRIIPKDMILGVGYSLHWSGDKINVLNASGAIVSSPDGSALNMGDSTLTRPEIKDYSETVKVHGSLSSATNASLEDGNVHTFTVGGAFTLSLTNPPATTKAGSITFIITNGASSTLTWDTDIDWVNGTAPNLTASGVDVVSCVTTDAGATWLGFVVGLDVK